MSQDNALNILNTKVVFVSFIKQIEDTNCVIRSFQDQEIHNKELIIFTNYNIQINLIENLNNIQIIYAKPSEVRNVLIDYKFPNGIFISVIHPDDFYGPKYSYSMALEAQKNGMAVVGKGAHFVAYNKDQIRLEWPSAQNQFVQQLAMRTSIVASDLFPNVLFSEYNNNTIMRGGKYLSVDPYNYCYNGTKHDIGKNIKNMVCR